ncbi:hypothetical protein G9F72_001230 [Clostridium estertheticum]|uniref:hypothetical protein n=1 Tax=Clostridium estertheticum TaxID=238834 RepID=UPI0013E96C09|nr:hypothetical protein [Clostridium estertheticum]MBZ9684982.1 hypothetical protein [Clostridium estertheticum]
MNYKIIKVKCNIKKISLASSRSSKKIILNDGKEFYVPISENLVCGDLIEAELRYQGTAYNGQLIMFAENIKKVKE